MAIMLDAKFSGNIHSLNPQHLLTGNRSSAEEDDVSLVNR